MSVKTRAHVENISPQKAQMWLDDNYERQRPVRRKYVDFYASEMEKGRWRPTNPIAFAYLNGDRYLVNGQHTLLAIVSSGETLRFNPVHYHDVEAMSDIDDLYAHYDIGRGRTYVNSMNAYGIVDKTGLSSTAVNRISAAVKYIAGGFSSYPPLMANEDIIGLVFSRVSDYKLLDDAISPCGTVIRNKIMMQPTLAVALVTLEYQQKQAIEFWAQVAQTDGLFRGDPRLALHKALITMERTGRRFPNGYENKYFSAVAAYGWNKWFGGMEMTLLKPNIAESQVTFNGKIVIDGTPYDGKNNPT